MKFVRAVVAAGLVVLLAPLAFPLVALAIAAAGGCRLNEGNMHPCVILGIDWGEVLYGMFVTGWLGLITLPIAMIVALGWLVMELVLFLRRRARSS